MAGDSVFFGDSEINGDSDFFGDSDLAGDSDFRGSKTGGDGDFGESETRGDAVIFVGDLDFFGDFESVLDAELLTFSYSFDSSCSSTYPAGWLSNAANFLAWRPVNIGETDLSLGVIFP